MGCVSSIMRGFGFSLGAQAARKLTSSVAASGNKAASDTKECPECAETIKAAARKCRFCNASLGG